MSGDKIWGCFAYIASQLAKARGQNHVFDNQQITAQKHNSLFLVPHGGME